MKVVHYERIELAPVEMEGAVGARTRCLIGERDGAANFIMRQFEIDPGGNTPQHAHEYEHEVFILEGSGVVMEGNLENPLRPGTVVFIPPNQPHQFRNTGPGPLKFLCLIPNSTRGTANSCVAACGCE